MDHPEYRKLRFDLDHTVPFQWNPEHPIFGLWGNAVSFLAVGWEKYILCAVRDVLDDIDDPDVHQEAKIFIAQEAQHAAAPSPGGHCVRHRLRFRGIAEPSSCMPVRIWSAPQDSGPLHCRSTSPPNTE